MPRNPNSGRRRGRPPKHGGRLAARVIADNEIDGRTKLARMLRDGADALADQFGGWVNVSYARERKIRHLVKLDMVTTAEADWIIGRIAETGVIDDSDKPLSLLLGAYATHLAGLLRGLTQLEDDAAKSTATGPDLASYLANGAAQHTQRADATTTTKAKDESRETNQGSGRLAPAPANRKEVPK